MERLQIIPPHIHGILDYLAGIVLVLAPNIFGFVDVGGAAVWIPRVLGIAVLGMALLTDYRVGLIKVIPMQVHLSVDYMASILLVISPFIFGFSDEPANVWLPHIVAGAGIFIITLLTRPAPDLRRSESVHTSY